MRFLRHLARVTAILLLTGTAAAAQQATAQLSGRVADQSSAVLPGVTVTATQTDTGFTRTVVTDGDGSYVMPNLPTGPYRLEVMLQGFRTYAQTGIVLQVGDNVVINAVLEVGELAETVSVEAATPLVNVRSAGISEVVENERIVELPLQGRNVTDLVVLAGAAVPAGNASAWGARGSAISVAGGLSYGVAYSLDGAIHNEPNTNLNLPLPFPDALQEFSVATSGLAAENGVHSGASVNAVTKSGTNTFHGNAFEFLRDKRFNATSPLASLGPDGRRRDDGLVRNQFGGTLGGPVVRDKLFFFFGSQGTITRRTVPDRIAFVPTAAMLAGDFTAAASAGCNAGRPVTLRAPFVNNRIDPALFSRAALFIASRLPTPEDACGTVTTRVPLDYNEQQWITKLDYQLSTDHTVFGRFLTTPHLDKPPYPRSGSLLGQTPLGADAYAHSVTFGDTLVLGSNAINSLRFAYNAHGNHTLPVETFDTNDAGIKVYTYVPGELALVVRGAFSLPNGADTKARYATTTYQVAEDLTMIRGRHQLSAGLNLAYWTAYQEINARSIGHFEFNGSVTGLPLADLLTGRLARLEHAAPGIADLDQTYVGAYGSDAWRMTDRLTVNAGLRWEPFFGAALNHGSISNFVLDNFRRGVRSTVYVNAPPGLIFPGDPGFPDSNSGLNPQWGNLSPRAGIAWDVTGDGRTAVRSSYGIAYDFPTAAYQYINANSAPYGNRLRVDFPAGGLEDPYLGVPGGDTHPVPVPPPHDIAFPFYGTYGSIDPDINSPRVQSWNVTFERQIGQDWQASAAYLGSYSDRLWGQVQINPGVFLGTGPCTLSGVFYPVCTVAGNLDQRRVLSLENPEYGRYYGPVDLNSDVGTQDYHALKLSFRRRSTTGVSLNGNYTRSSCVGNTTPGGFNQISAGYQKPEDPAFDRGNCVSRRDHVANFTAGYQTPEFANAGLRLVASDWRASGIVNARSGSWLPVTQSINRASATTGIQGLNGQPVNKVLDNPYGNKTTGNYLNPAAFALPPLGTLGDAGFFSVEGPGFWTVDLALSRLISLAAMRSLELRIEAFNVFNNFNWGNPVSVLDDPNFGRILTAGGDPRILQFGVKYAF
jgi:carboxypeptidase family protein/TonB-dependent receptor-like protein